MATRDAGLTPREAEVTGLLALGLTGEEIARRLELSPETVRTHIRNAMGHLGARTRAHLVARALGHSLITVAPEASDGQQANALSTPQASRGQAGRRWHRVGGSAGSTGCGESP